MAKNSIAQLECRPPEGLVKIQIPGPRSEVQIRDSAAFLTSSHAVRKRLTPGPQALTPGVPWGFESLAPPCPGCVKFYSFICLCFRVFCFVFVLHDLSQSGTRSVGEGRRPALLRSHLGETEEEAHGPPNDVRAASVGRGPRSLSGSREHVSPWAWEYRRCP